MKILRLILIFAACALFFVGCSGTSPLDTPLPKYTNIPTTPPTSTLPIPTVTPLPTLIMTPIPTPNFNADLEYHCLEISPSLTNNMSVSGTIILGNELVNLKTGQRTLLGSNSEIVRDISVSPNRQLLKYVKGSVNKDGSFHPEFLIIATLDGQLATISWQMDWWSAGWLDDDRLLVTRIKEPHNSTIIFNPFGGQVEQEIFLDDQNIFSIGIYTGAGGEQARYVSAAYDPSLTYVVYLRNPNQTVLMDLKTGKVLATLLNVHSGSAPGISDIGYPEWSPGFDSFVIEAPILSVEQRELYRVSNDGEIERLTYFTDRYSYARFRNYSWSKDGRYISFWLRINLESADHLAILDTMTGIVTSYCIPGFLNGLYFDPPEPIWSPDSHQLLVEVHDDERNIDNFRVVLVDIDHGFAAVIADNETPMGWLAEK